MCLYYMLDSVTLDSYEPLPWETIKLRLWMTIDVVSKVDITREKRWE